MPIIAIENHDLKIILKSIDFLNKNKYDINFLHLTFLSHKPLPENVALIKGEFTKDDYLITDCAVYIYCPYGYGNTKLNITFFENKLKVAATTRNWKTLAQLLLMASTK